MFRFQDFRKAAEVPSKLEGPSFTINLQPLHASLSADPPWRAHQTELQIRDTSLPWFHAINPFCPFFNLQSSGSIWVYNSLQNIKYQKYQPFCYLEREKIKP